MNKTIAIKLKTKAEEIAKNFSRPERELNKGGEIFTVHEIIPASEKTAFIIFKKSSGKFGLCFMYYLKDPANGYWQGFFPSESHLHGMRKTNEILQRVEEYNYPKNFREV